MAERSKRIVFDVPEDKINKENIKLWKKYEMNMDLRELSKKTIYGYKTDLYAWFKYIYMFQDNKSVLEIDEDDLTEFFYYCKSEGNNTRRMRRRMAPISAFYDFLRKKRIVRENPMDFIDRPKKDNDVVVQTFLTQEQIDEILDKLEKLPNKLHILTYVALSLSSLARVNAIISSKWEQVNFESCYIEGVVEKEGYIVDLDFDDYTKSLLLKLKEEREKKEIDCEYIFCSRYNKTYKQINLSTANDWSKLAGKLIGIDTLHPHDWRKVSPLI